MPGRAIATSCLAALLLCACPDAPKGLPAGPVNIDIPAAGKLPPVRILIESTPVPPPAEMARLVTPLADVVYRSLKACAISPEGSVKPQKRMVRFQVEDGKIGAAQGEDGSDPCMRAALDKERPELKGKSLSIRARAIVAPELSGAQP